MKVLVFTFVILSISAFGQNPQDRKCESVMDSSTNRQIFSKVDKEAKIIGGMDKLYGELSAVRLPKNPETDQINFSISIIVEINGSISNLMTIPADKDAKLEAELLRIFKKYKWEPALCNGIKVPTRVVLRVVS